MLTVYYFFTHSVSQFLSLLVWWYSRGLYLVLSRFWLRQRIEAHNIGVLVWLKNFFVPMFHDYTVIGRLLSVGFRFFIIIGKTIRLFVGILLRLVFIVLWLALPVVVGWGLVNYLVNQF